MFARLAPGFAVLFAAGLGYLYGLNAQSMKIVQSGPIPAADPPSPSVAQLEQAAYIFANGLDELQRDVKAIRASLPPIEPARVPSNPITWPSEQWRQWLTVVSWAATECPK